MRLKAKFENSPESGIYREYPFLDKNGDPLWPGKFMTAEDIEKEKSKILSESAWQREYLLRIIGTDEQIIKPEWIQYYDSLPHDIRPRKTIMGVDMATGAEDGDYTAIVGGYLFGYDSNAIMYIIPNPINKRLDLNENVIYTKEYSKQIRLPNSEETKILVESVIFQDYLIHELKLSYHDVEPWKTKGLNKETRLRAVAYLIQTGKILFPKTGCEEIIEQAVGFP